MKVNIYFDQDGVLAKWKKAPPEKTFEDRFFLDLLSDQLMIDVFKDIEKHFGHESTAILTAVYMHTNARSEKTRWKRREGLKNAKIVFVPYGESKYDYIDNTAINVLIDDYSKNLHDWHAKGGVAIKYFNGVNGHNGTWKGHSVSHQMSKKEIVDTITKIVSDEVRERTKLPA